MTDDLHANAGVQGALADDFGRLAQRVAAALERTRARADDEAIHDLRVATRRLASALELWKPAWRRGARRRLRRGLRRLRRVLGRAREAEVHDEMLRAWSASATPAAPALEPAMASIARGFAERARRSRRRAARATMRPAVRRMVRRLRGGPPLRRATPPMGALVERAHGRLATLEERARAALCTACGAGDEGAAHAARIAIKRWRYAVERLLAVVPAGHDGGLVVLAHAQRVLGHAQDLTTLRVRLAKDLKRAGENGDPRIAQALSTLLDRLEREAKEVAEALRQLPSELARIGADAAPAAPPSPPPDAAPLAQPERPRRSAP